MIVSRDQPALKIELPSREIAELTWKIVVQSKRQLSFVSRRRPLVGIRQAGSIAVYGTGHSELARFRGHAVGERGFTACQPLGKHRGGVIGGFRYDSEDQILHLHRI